MKSKQKQTPTEIIDNQRQTVVEKIIEDMKRDGLRWAEPYLSLPNHRTTPSPAPCIRAETACILASSGSCAVHGQPVDYLQPDKGCRLTCEKGCQSPRSSRNGNSSPSTRKTRIPARRNLPDANPKLVGYWNVFNAEDIEGIPPENAPVHLTTERQPSHRTLRSLPDAPSSRAAATSEVPPTLRLPTASSSPRERPFARMKRSPAPAA